jgi:hypothetical protein
LKLRKTRHDPWISPATRRHRKFFAKAAQVAQAPQAQLKPAPSAARGEKSTAAPAKYTQEQKA